jgi:ADP-ribose pyrophosphatase YjhB (NUDIX family)
MNNRHDLIITKSMKRDYPDRPIVGVGAVIIHDGRALIVQRAGEPRKGEWTVPGGVLEVGETLRSGTEREVLEETGLVIKAGPVVDVFENIWPDATGKTQFHYVLVDFLCNLISGELKAATDVSAARWIAFEELDGLELIGKTADAIRAGFAMREVEALMTRST